MRRLVKWPQTWALVAVWALFLATCVRCSVMLVQLPDDPVANTIRATLARHYAFLSETGR